MSNVEWVALAIPVLSSIVHYTYRYLRDRQVSRFLWRVYKASSFSDGHLWVAADALRVAHRGVASRRRTSRAPRPPR